MWKSPRVALEKNIYIFFFANINYIDICKGCRGLPPPPPPPERSGGEVEGVGKRTHSNFFNLALPSPLSLSEEREEG